jgi:DNA-binding CsgD family transcriptional regulator
VDEEAEGLLEEAARALGDRAPELRVRLLAGLARALDFRGAFDRGVAVRREAEHLARRLGDRAGLAALLVRSYWSFGTTPLPEVLEMLTEAKALGEELGDIEIRAEAVSWRVPAFVTLADIDSARRDAAALAEIAAATAQPFMLHVAEHYRSAIALADGRLAEAEERASRANEWGRLPTGRNPPGSYGIQMFGVRREQGRLAGLAPAMRVLAADSRRSGPWAPGLVALLAELGMEGEARRELARIAAGGLEPFRQSLWMASLAYLADAAALLGDQTIAALVYLELEPLTGGNLVIGQLVAWYGAADRHLRMLAATLGDWERAERHFEAALELNRQMGAQTWLAHTAHEYARMLLASGADRARVDALLGEAAALAERIGMPALLGRIAALGSSVPSVSLPDGLSPREAEILRLVARGLSNREIGAELFISEHTAANHIRSILPKTGSGNRTEAASYAHRHGLAEEPARG